MNAHDTRPSLGGCNAAAGLGLAASNWQRAPRPPVRMASAPPLSPSAPHHSLRAFSATTTATAAAARPAASGQGASAAMPSSAAPARCEAAAAAVPPLRVSVRGPGPQGANPRPAGAQGPAHAHAAAGSASFSPAAGPRPALSDVPARWAHEAGMAAPLQASEPAAPWAVRAGRPARARSAPREIVFEFIGQGALSVLSSITGRCYRFEQPGARLVVDARDVNQLTRVSLLRSLEAA